MNDTPTEEITQILEWIATEIGSGKTLGATPRDHLWNDATERCLVIVERYRSGQGLFQMVAAAEARDAAQLTKSEPYQEPELL